MKKGLLMLLFVGSMLPILSAQKHLEGLWSGEITKGGIYSKEAYKFELYIEVEKGKIKGRSYIYVENDEIIQMDVNGKLYEDRSIYLTDIEFIPIEGSTLIPPFTRKYQLVYNRSIWENSMEGYWQEIIPKPLAEKRRRGRISLKKIKDSKA